MNSVTQNETRHDGGIVNSFTVDVEDYYMVSAFADMIQFEDWPYHESRVERNTHAILEILDRHGVKSTFFVLGWIAERHPRLISAISASGHEVACHGYKHRLVYDMTPAEFTEDTRKTKIILEDIIGEPVIGYRAASYSIVQRTMWALDILIEQGFLYDSSIFPIHHDRYGIPGGSRFPHTIRRADSTIREFPPSTYRIFRQNLPVAGGGYLRLLPLGIIKAAIKRINEKEKEIAILYIHPWEVDPAQPRLNGRWQARLRHYMNLDSTIPKIESILQAFRFRPLRDCLGNT